MISSEQAIELAALLSEIAVMEEPEGLTDTLDFLGELILANETHGDVDIVRQTRLRMADEI